MPFEFIQIPANGQGSAKEELNKLLRGGRIASVRKEFVPNGEDSFWAFCVEYLDGISGAAAQRGTGPRPDYKELLNEADFASFALLRELRKGIAERDALPAYSIFTNEQLAAMVTGKVASLSALGSIAETRPPSRPCPDDKTHEVPPGAGRPAEAGSKAPGGAAVLPLLFRRPHHLLFPH